MAVESLRGSVPPTSSRASALVILRVRWCDLTLVLFLLSQNYLNFSL